MAGQIGIDADPRTLRELMHMVTGKGRSDWDLFLPLLVVTSKGLLKDPPNFKHPYRKIEKHVDISLSPKESLDFLKGLFGGSSGSQGGKSVR